MNNKILKEQIAKLKKTPQYQKFSFLIMPVISLVLCIGLIGGVLLPKGLEYIETKNKLAELNDKLKFYEEKKEILSGINQEEYKINLEVALNAIPEDKEIPSSVEQIFLLVNSSGMSLNNITFGNVGVQTKGLGSYSIKVDLTGSAEQLKEFFEITKEMPRVIKIGGVEVSSAGEFNKIQANVELIAYYEALPNTIGGIDQPVSKITDAQLERLNKIKSSSSRIPAQPLASGSGTPTQFKSDPFN